MIFYRPISPAHAVTFDLDDTLYDNHPTIMQAERLLREKMAVHFPKAAAVNREQSWELKRALIAKDPRLGWDMGELRRQTLRQLLAEEAGNAVNEAVEELFDYFYDVRSDVPIDDHIYTLLDTLSQRVPLVAITNGNVNVEKIGLAPYFKDLFHASLDNPAKPHGAMFERAAASLGIHPSKILHVGDGLINDVQGAYTSGFMSAWYACNRTMNLRNERTTVLPDVELAQLEELLDLVVN